MTYDEYHDEILRLQAKANAAAADEQWRISMLAALELAEFTLDHPEHWPDHDQDKIKRGCEELVARTEKILGMRNVPETEI